MFTSKIKNGCVLFALVARASVASAQSPLPPELGFSYHHASTAMEGELRGRAELTHANGGYWLSLSQASVYREQARIQALENDKRWVEYKVSSRAWHESDRKCRTVERRVANEAARPYRYSAFRLSRNQFDRSTGTIAWPKPLQAVEYDVLRGNLDELFHDEGRNGGKLAAEAVEVAQCLDTLAAEVRRNRSHMLPAEYLATEKFLCGVKYEAEFPLFHTESADRPLTGSTQSTVQINSPIELN